MGYRLCIAETPAGGRDIARVVGAANRHSGYYEGAGYLVTWADGQMVRLAGPGVYGYVPQAEIFAERRAQAYAELPLAPAEFQLEVIKATQDQYFIAEKLLNRADVDLVVICGDMCAESSALLWLIIKKSGCCKPVARFCATSMTDGAISSAMGALRPMGGFMGGIDGELCRKNADWILGESMSRALSLKYSAGISAGRLQPPTLFFVVQRYLEAKRFEAGAYYTMRALLEGGTPVYWERGVKGSDLFPAPIMDSEGRVIDRSAADAAALAVAAGAPGIVKEFTVTKMAADRPRLYDIAGLQKDANMMFGYSAAATLATAQSLYERFKLLTCPRTGSRYITSGMAGEAGGLISLIGDIGKYRGCVDRLLSDGLNFGSRIVDDAKAALEHAIVVTGNMRDYASIKLVPGKEEAAKGVTPDSLKAILDLVICRMLLSLSRPYVYERTVLKVEFPNGLVFTASGSAPLYPGWKGMQALLSGDASGRGGQFTPPDPGQMLPPFKVGQQICVSSCTVEAKRTAPPKLHTEATLLAAMECAGAVIEGGAVILGEGIGAPASRAGIIQDLFDAGFVKYADSGENTLYLEPTGKGMSVLRVLPKEIYSPHAAAGWENMIGGVARGDLGEKEFMDGFLPFAARMVNEAKAADTGVFFKREREAHGVCPWCGGDVRCHENKTDEGKILHLRYYCSGNGCEFTLNTNDVNFHTFLGRHLTAKEALVMIARGRVILDAHGRSGGAHKREFRFVRRKYKGKTYCNVVSECQSSLK